MTRNKKKKAADTTMQKKVCSNTTNDAKKGVLTGLWERIEEATSALDSDYTHPGPHYTSWQTRCFEHYGRGGLLGMRATFIIVAYRCYSYY